MAASFKVLLDLSPKPGHKFEMVILSGFPGSLHACVCFSILLYQTYGLLVLYQIETLVNEPFQILIYFSGLQIAPILMLSSGYGSTFRILNTFLTLHSVWLAAVFANAFYMYYGGRCTRSNLCSFAHSLQYHRTHLARPICPDRQNSSAVLRFAKLCRLVCLRGQQLHASPDDPVETLLYVLKEKARQINEREQSKWKTVYASKSFRSIRRATSGLPTSTSKR